MASQSIPGGAAKRQSVGPRGAVSRMVARLDGNLHAACPLPDTAPARMPTQAERRRSMPKSLLARCRFCPPRRSASEACPYHDEPVDSLRLAGN